ncbi:hypothetical protein ACRHK7_06625 [Weissella tructae]|uniref:hypothetical protein n=1 Tax=Weissella tructae TaxID=887702 RepID=UPI003D93381E
MENRKPLRRVQIELRNLFIVAFSLAIFAISLVIVLIRLYPSVYIFGEVVFAVTLLLVLLLMLFKQAERYTVRH